MSNYVLIETMIDSINAIAFGAAKLSANRESDRVLFSSSKINNHRPLSYEYLKTLNNLNYNHRRYIIYYYTQYKNNC
ncbi:MAG: hypothetical protein Kow0049_01590 [Stanieria sp.]